MFAIARRSPILAAAALVAAIGATAALAQQGAPAKSLVPGGDRPDFVLAYTGDVIGYLDPCG